MSILGDADPEALLEWLASGQEDQRDMQAMALEHLCMALLISDNVDRCFETYPPKTFIPALCQIFLDDLAPDSILEATARALTYYLDVSAECTRRILQTEGTVRALCGRLLIASLDNQSGKDLAEQCIKVLEHMSSRDLSALLEAGALNALLAFIKNFGLLVHKDTLRSAVISVARLCTKIDPNDSGTSSIVESLTELLRHTDDQISDASLRCFISLADRFSRRGADSAVLIQFGLLDLLLERAAKSPVRNPASAESSSTALLSILSLIQVLIKSSSEVTRTLVEHNNLMCLINLGLEGDSRTAVETVRLMETLVTVLCEGRLALGKQKGSPSPESRPSSRLKGGLAGRLGHHVIEAIRNQDYDALIDALDGGDIDMGILDDVGQSLISLASILGSSDSGSDGNEDRAAVLERVLERSDDGSREFLKLLTTFSELKKLEKQIERDAAELPPSKPEKTPVKEKEKDTGGENPLAGQKLSVLFLPLIAKKAAHSVVSAVRMSAGGLLLKLLDIIPNESLQKVCADGGSSPDGIELTLTKFLSGILSHEESPESHLLGLEMIDKLLDKAAPVFLDVLHRAGIVGQIANFLPDKTAKPAAVDPSVLEGVQVSKFGDWNLIRKPGAMYLWTDFIVIKLDEGDSSYIEVFYNGRVSRMGLVGEFREEISAADVLPSLSNLLNVIQSSPEVNVSVFSEQCRFGAWVFSCIDTRAIRIKNTEERCEIHLRHDTIDAITLSRSLSAPLSLLAVSRISSLQSGEPINLSLRPDQASKTGALKKQIEELAVKISSGPLQNSRPTPRGPMGKLMEVVENMQAVVAKQMNAEMRREGEKPWSDLLRHSFKDVVRVIGDGSRLSPFEVQATNIVGTLNLVLNPAESPQRVDIWKSVMHQADNASDHKSISENLVRFFVSVLESVEKFPISSPDQIRNGFYQLTHPIPMRLEIRGSSKQLLDRSGRRIKIDPLATVAEIDSYLWKKLYKNWYDYERNELTFIKAAKNGPIKFEQSHDFDEKGIIYWIGSNAGTNRDWVNPAAVDLIVMHSSDGKTVPCGNLSDVCGRSVVPAYMRTTEGRQPWIAVDLGLMVNPTKYTLKHGRGSGALRSWIFQGSVNGVQWTDLKRHVNDTSLSSVGSTASWTLNSPEESSYRVFRIMLTGENAEAERCISLSGFEIYGTVTGVCDDVGKVFQNRFARFLRPGIRSAQSLTEPSQVRVIRGRDWKWGNQDGTTRCLGTIVARHADDWVDVIWDHNPAEGHTYRMGADGKFDLHILSARELSTMAHTGSSYSRSLSPPLEPSQGAFVIHRTNKSTSPSPVASVTRPPRSVSIRTTDSTLSLPETIHEASMLLISTEQTASSDQLNRATFVSPHISRAEPVMHLNTTSGGDSSSRPSTSASGIDISLSGEVGSQLQQSDTPQPQDDTLSDLVETGVRILEASDAQGSSMYHESMSISEKSTPAGSMASLNEQSVFQTVSNVGQLSVSVPNLAVSSGRTRIARLSTGQPESLREDVSTSSDHIHSYSSVLMAAQSVPALGRQVSDSGIEPRGMTSHLGRTNLESVRATSSDSSDFYRMLSAYAGVELADEEIDIREEDGFVTISSHSSQLNVDVRSEDTGTDEGSSEEESSDPQQLRSTYAEDFIVRHQFSSLLPNFDPRPGRNNINQTAEITLRLLTKAELESCFNPSSKENLRMSLSLRRAAGPELSAIDPEASVLNLVLECLSKGDARMSSNYVRRGFEQVVSLIYGDKCSSGFPPRKDSAELAAAVPCCCPNDPNFGHDLLILLRRLFSTSVPAKVFEYSHSDVPVPNMVVDPSAFHSQKLSSKVMSQLNDVVSLVTNTTPAWIEYAMMEFPMIFPFDVRRMYFASSSFGSERAIIWAQTRRDQFESATRSGRLDPMLQDIKLGRQKHSRIKVSRHHIVDWAMTVLFSMGGSKSVLEFEFENEEGTGLGPTLEFFALTAAELQRKDLGMWLCEDSHDIFRNDIDLGAGGKPFGYYVNSPGGLFPAPYPPEHPSLPILKNLYRCLGALIGRALMDGRLVDMPFAEPFLKMICERAVVQSPSGMRAGSPDLREHHSADAFAGRKAKKAQRRSKKTGFRALNRSTNPSWFEGLLGLKDLEEVDPHRGKFLRALQGLMKKKQQIEENVMLNDDHKREKLKGLRVELKQADGSTDLVPLDDLGLTFEFSPSSKVFKYLSCDLIPDGDTVPVTIDNVDLYVEYTLDFCLNSGIRTQMDAFREGFEKVFPMDKLRMFSGPELRTLICGDQCPSWTREELLTFTEPKLGYTVDSPGFQRFVNVMLKLSGEERKAFVQFATGCSSLPPGGMANLFPRLTVVRKMERGEDEGYPSVNTCVHYLKLPVYSSEEILYQRLMAATKEKGFHFN